jgi:hypothetical protein
MRVTDGRWSVLVSCCLILGACSQDETRTSTNAPRARQAPAPPREQPGRTLLDTKSLSLQELTARAARIVYATVVSVESVDQTVTDGDVRTTVKVRDVALKLIEPIKGDGAPGAIVHVRQLEDASSPLKPGEEVLWYLSRESRLGLTQPLGVFSGDFRVERTGDEVTAMNLAGNEGLWNGTLWEGDGFDRTSVLREAEASHVTALEIRSMDKSARKDSDGRRVPLKLLINATKSQVAPPAGAR